MLSQLQIGLSELAWVLPAPTLEQRTALLALLGDRAFRTAIETLLAGLDSGEGSTAPLAEFVPRPSQDELSTTLQTRLFIDGDTLRWTSPAPNDVERVELSTLIADDALMDALVALRQQIDASYSVPLPPWPHRPRQIDLPEHLSDQLTIAPTKLTWRGRLGTTSFRDDLVALQGDTPFVDAIQQIVTQIDSQVLTVPFTAGVRPAPGGLGALTDKLLLGRALLRCHGPMTQQEVPMIRSLFTLVADKHAVDRLYQATQSSGLRGRELKIRTRRGAAPPSALCPIPSKAF
jgi:hypothetical protein